MGAIIEARLDIAPFLALLGLKIGQHMLKYVADNQATKNRLARKNAIYATKKGLSEHSRKVLKARPKGGEICCNIAVYNHPCPFFCHYCNI